MAENASSENGSAENVFSSYDVRRQVLAEPR
jgi:hypothetical protein